MMPIDFIIFDNLSKMTNSIVIGRVFYMALANYYHLREKKKMSLLNAIEACLKTEDYDKLSISDIVAQADISRGSFYNYFKDKSDAVNTLIDDKIRYLLKIFKTCVHDCHGKLFDGVIDAYKKTKDVLRSNIYVALLKNMKFFLGVGTKMIYTKEYEAEVTEFITWLIENTEEGKTYLNSKEKMANIIDLIITVFSNMTLKAILTNENNIHDNDFEFKINVIKAGVNNYLVNK